MSDAAAPVTQTTRTLLDVDRPIASSDARSRVGVVGAQHREAAMTAIDRHHTTPSAWQRTPDVAPWLTLAVIAAASAATLAGLLFVELFLSLLGV